MSELVTVTLKMSPALRDKLRAAAEEWGQSVSAILLEGAEAMLNAGAPGETATNKCIEPARVVTLQPAACKPEPGQMVISVPVEVIKLIPGDDKVATVETLVIERFGYGMYRRQATLKALTTGQK